MAFLSSPVRFILRPTSSSPRVCTDGQTDGRSYGDVITKFSRFDELPIFFTNGVSLERFARSSFAIKIQPHTIDLSTRLWGINPTSSVVISQCLVLSSIILGLLSIYRNCFIAGHLLRVSVTTASLTATGFD